MTIHNNDTASGTAQAPDASTHEPTSAASLLSGPIQRSSSDVGGGGVSVTGSSSQVSEDDNAVEVVSGPNGVATAAPSGATNGKPGFSRMPSNKGSRFDGGLAGIVEASVASSIEHNLGNWTAPYSVTAKQLGDLAQEPSRVALADLIYKGVINLSEAEVMDEETPSPTKKLQQDVLKLTQQIRAAEDANLSDPKAQLDADKNADMAANVLTSVLLRSSPETGIDPREVEHRREVFGTNAITPKKLDSYLKLCWNAVQDFVLMMLIVLGVISIIVETTTLRKDENCSTCWIEGAAILVSVVIVVNVTASIDYAKQFAFLRLTRSLHDTNTKAVIRDGVQVSVIDDEIVVGDVLSVNSHNLASIPADCVLLGPVGGSELHMDESALTGESKAIRKRPGDVVLSGTHATQGSAKLVVIAVGVNSVAGRIRARVYESGDHEDELGDDSEENSPLFVKLDAIAKRIGIGGTVAATIAFLGALILGLAVDGDPPSEIVTYLITAITVLAVAVPEGLPLAVTLALAFSSNKMMKEMNLVKHLDACETMGCATTICTDKTGTLTANKMTARALYAGGDNYLPDDPAETLGAYIKRNACDGDLIDVICRCIAIDTMNETVLYYTQDGSAVESSAGNPTEVALLHLVHDFGFDYAEIRNTTKGRSDQGQLGAHLSLGRHIEFTSARKIMSWAVPQDDGSYRLYCKGAAEVVLARCGKYVHKTGETRDFGAIQDESKDVALAYARRGMRCLGLAYRDVPADFNWDATSGDITNSDGTPALLAETEMTCIGLVGIEDPLRHEVPPAIEKCYGAGIDVRMVTGDNPNTAVSIAYQAGILRDFHFLEGTTERVATNLKENVLMEGKTFRNKVYRVDEEGNKEFDQAAFDKIWPRLRVLARSSPDDKLTLAHGLNQSNLFADKEYCKRLEATEGIKIFPDRQVVAMTGDGTNDAPALKRADIGFAMGVAGTQIAKDAADIILLDDNFASIVTAAKWGRNVYASIQKFLQFQLTVNISAVVTALVGALTYQKSPLAAIQLLWVNLLMDSLASLALASEPPTDELLQKPPVNRTDSMFTKHMLANMLGQAFYQIVVVMTLLFAGPTIFGIEPGNVVEKNTGENSLHYTIIFNSFVWMQLFNEVNARKLKGEFNVFKGVLSNPLFCTILVSTSILQVLIVQYGSIAFHVVEGGLPGEYWAVSLVLGMGSLPVQQIINLIYRLSQRYKGYRIKKRLAKDGHLAVQNIGPGGVSTGSIGHDKRQEKPHEKKE